MLKDKFDEYHNIADLFFKINENIYVSFEMNTEYFSDVKHRNFMIFNKLYSRILKTGENPSLLKNKYFYQVNFNANCKVSDLSTNQVCLTDKARYKYINNYDIYLVNLDFYRKNYYNGCRDEKTCLMAALMAENFSELYEILLNVFTKKETDKLVKEVECMTFEKSNSREWEDYWLKEEVKFEKADRFKREKKEAREDGHSKGLIDGISIGHSQGFSEGHTQGLSEGERKKELSIAESMLKKEFSLEDTAEITGLPIQKVKRLKAAL